MRFTDYKIPARVEDASAALKDLGDSGYLMAGGTSLVFQRGKVDRTAVDIMRLGIDHIEDEGDAFRVGAATRIAAIQGHRAEGWVLDRVARELATQQIRNMSTLGGNLVRVFPWNDFPVALQVLRCEMTIKGSEERVLKGSEFFGTQPHRHFQPGDILTSVKISKVPAGTGFGYSKERRTSGDFGLATAAALVELDGRKFKSVRVAAGSALPFPKRLAEVESFLAGRPVSKGALADDGLLDDIEKAAGGFLWRGRAGLSDEYAARLAAVAIRDAVAQAALEAMNGGGKNG